MKMHVFCTDTDTLSIRYDIDVPKIEDKKKQVKKLHSKFLEEYPNKRILEVSTRSGEQLGQQLSAFNLKYYHPKRKQFISVESAYQASKVFDSGEQFTDLYDADSYTAKMDKRLWGKKIISYKFHNQHFDIEPPTFFYNWLYLKTLQQNKHLLNGLIKYDSFTDTAGNLSKSINCQARSCAIAVSLLDKGLFNKALQNLNNFREIVYCKEEPVIEIVSGPQQYCLFEFA